MSNGKNASRNNIPHENETKPIIALIVSLRKADI